MTVRQFGHNSILNPGGAPGAGGCLWSHASVWGPESFLQAWQQVPYVPKVRRPQPFPHVFGGAGGAGGAGPCLWSHRDVWGPDSPLQAWQQVLNVPTVCLPQPFSQVAPPICRECLGCKGMRRRRDCMERVIINPFFFTFLGESGDHPKDRRCPIKEIFYKNLEQII